MEGALGMRPLAHLGSRRADELCSCSSRVRARPCSTRPCSTNKLSALNSSLALQVLRGQALRRTPAAFSAPNTRQVRGACCACLRLLGRYPSSAISERVRRR